MGLEGRRFTLTHALPPDTVPDLDRFNFWQSQSLYQPPNDRRVEIAGLAMGLYPAVIGESPTGFTLEAGYLEGGQVFQWVRETITSGSLVARRSASVAVVDSALNEVSRMNYFGCFPKRYEHFTGFAQSLMSKERVFLQCDSRAPA